MSWENRGSRPRKEKWGAPVARNPKRPKANCHVFLVWGKKWVKYGLHYFYKKAVEIAQGLAKLPANSKAWIVVKRKKKILWSSDGEMEGKIV